MHACKGLSPAAQGGRIRLQHGRRGFHPRAGKTPCRRKGSPLRYSCPGNPVVRGAWRATVPGAVEEFDCTVLPSSETFRITLCFYRTLILHSQNPLHLLVLTLFVSVLLQVLEMWMVMVSNMSKYSVLGDFQEIWLISVISFQFFGFFFLRCSCFFLDQKRKGWLHCRIIWRTTF